MNDENQAISDQLPDRLSVDPNSPYYNAEVLARDVGIRFKGAEKTNVEEYCVSEGWVRVTAGNAKDRYGNPADHQGSRPGRAVFSRQGVVLMLQRDLIPVIARSKCDEAIHVALEVSWHPCLDGIAGIKDVDGAGPSPAMTIQ